MDARDQGSRTRRNRSLRPVQRTPTLTITSGNTLDTPHTLVSSHASVIAPSNPVQPQLVAIAPVFIYPHGTREWVVSMLLVAQA
jgi:hypothetical protein